MKISVIIPYYNPDTDVQTEKLLLRAVTSVSDNLEGVCSYEIIVVNDGSPSDPDLSSISSGLRYIRRDHGMLGATRNTGIENASGDVISFLDADDYYYPGSLAPCIKTMKETGADLLGFGFRKTGNSLGIDSVRLSTPHFTAVSTGERYMQSHNLFGSACQYLISADLISKNALRFKENVYIEDEEFTPRLLFFSRKFIYTDYPVYAYYVHPGSIITTASPQMTELKSKHMVLAIKSLMIFRDEHQDSPHAGLDRKINTLAIDHLRRTLRRKDWRDSLPQQIQSLEQIGLYPLKTGNLPLKFRLFALLSGARPGQVILHIVELLYK